MYFGERHDYQLLSSHRRVVIVAMAVGAVRTWASAVARTVSSHVIEVPLSIGIARSTLASIDGCVAIVGLRDEDGVLAIDAVAALRDAARALPVVLCVSPREMGEARVSAFARAGVDDLMFFDGPPGQRELRSILNEHFAHLLPEPVFRSAVRAPAEQGLARAVEGWCYRNGFRDVEAERAAKHFGVDRKAVYRVLRAADLPPISMLVQNARLLHVAVQLDETPLSISEIASSLGFPGDSALRMLVRRNLGISSTELRARGAVREVLNHLHRDGGEPTG